MSESPFGHFGGYRKLHSFGFVCLVYHATTRFCRRVYPWKEDPLGKTSGQMIGAARSALQNMVEASSRAGTSKETEIRLLDVAKASLAELLGDYETFLTDNDQLVWSEKDERWQAVAALKLDEFSATEDVLHAFNRHIIAMRHRFACWLEHEDPYVAANAIIVIISRADSLLCRQMERTMADFEREGGFRERMTRLRMAKRKALKAAKPPSPPARPVASQWFFAKPKPGRILASPSGAALTILPARRFRRWKRNDQRPATDNKRKCGKAETIWHSCCRSAPVACRQSLLPRRPACTAFSGEPLRSLSSAMCVDPLGTGVVREYLYR